MIGLPYEEDELDAERRTDVRFIYALHAFVTELVECDELSEADFAALTVKVIQPSGIPTFVTL